MKVSWSEQSLTWIKSAETCFRRWVTAKPLGSSSLIANHTAAMFATLGHAASVSPEYCPLPCCLYLFCCKRQDVAAVAVTHLLRHQRELLLAHT